MKRTVLVAFVLLGLILVSSFGQAKELLEKSEALMTDGELYQALLVLEPILAVEWEKPDQEEALWLANALCETIVRNGDLMREFERIHGDKPHPRRRLEDYMEWDRIVTLNDWGADIGFDLLGGIYAYRYGFLRRLLELCPYCSRRPSIEYYLIQRGYNNREAVEKWLNDLRFYVNKNIGSNPPELYAAYLDIAHINDNLWQMLTYPDGTYSEPFLSGDPELDREKASQHKAEALKYYTKVIVSGYSGRFGYPSWFDTRNRFEELKQGKKTNHVWIIYD